MNVYREGEEFFTRSRSIAGNVFSEGIQENLGFSSLSEAETRKRKPQPAEDLWRSNSWKPPEDYEVAQTQRELDVQYPTLSRLVAQTPAVYYLPGSDRSGEHIPRIIERVAQSAHACEVAILSLGSKTTKEGHHFIENTAILPALELIRMDFISDNVS